MTTVTPTITSAQAATTTPQTATSAGPQWHVFDFQESRQKFVDQRRDVKIAFSGDNGQSKTALKKIEILSKLGISADDVPSHVNFALKDCARNAVNAGLHEKMADIDCGVEH
eukprot:GDKI01000247.1.p3 GENE.GDKI01000247.1~~GDKI01000247.1.p3  ORF type:complete len:112 (-),score=38.47 GDKI01000247.1:680-1015(-)